MSKKREYETETLFFNEVDLSKFRKGKDSATSFQWMDDSKQKGMRVTLLYSKKQKKYYLKVEWVKYKDKGDKEDVPF